MFLQVYIQILSYKVDWTVFKQNNVLRYGINYTFKDFNWSKSFKEFNWFLGLKNI